MCIITTCNYTEWFKIVFSCLAEDQGFISQLAGNRSELQNYSLKTDTGPLFLVKMWFHFVVKTLL